MSAPDGPGLSSAELAGLAVDEEGHVLVVPIRVAVELAPRVLGPWVECERFRLRPPDVPGGPWDLVVVSR